MPLTTPYDILYNQLLTQPFSLAVNELILNDCIQAVKSYVGIEQCLAVLSDFRANRSYIFPGTAGKLFGLSADAFEIDSAFEEAIFSRLNKDDLIERHELELQYIEFQKRVPVHERVKYITSCKLRVETEAGDHTLVTHRTMYIRNLEDGSVWLALCLYSPATFPTSGISGIDGKILNNETGELMWTTPKTDASAIRLSQREKELLQLVSRGLTSKEIASIMNIATNTVHRHRQNLIAKMEVSNLAEAVRTGLLLGII